MTDTEFFKHDLETWYREWVDHEVSEIVHNIHPHTENFEFEDVPF